MSLKFLLLTLYMPLCALLCLPLGIHSMEKQEEEHEFALGLGQQAIIPLPTISQQQLPVATPPSRATADGAHDREPITQHATRDDLLTLLLEHTGSNSLTQLIQKRHKETRLKTLASLIHPGNKDVLARFQPIRELILRASPEGKKWHRKWYSVLTQVVIKRNLEKLRAQGGVFTDDMFELMSKYFPNITTLDISGVCCTSTALEQLNAKNFPQLTHLYIQHCLVEPEQLTHLYNIASQLEVLDLRNNSLLTKNNKAEESTGHYLLRLLEKLSRIRKFFSQMVTAEHLRAIAHASPAITSLSIENKNLTKKALLSVLPLFTELRHLDYTVTPIGLQQGDISDDDFFAQLAALPQASQLETVRLSIRDITDASFAEHIAQFTSLKKVAIHCNLIGERGLQALAKAPCAQHLTHLKIQGYASGNTNTEELAKYLPQFKSLTSLSIDWYPISDEIFVALAEAPCSVTLTELTLHDSSNKHSLTDDTFIKYVERFTSLERLNLQDFPELTERSFIALANSPLAAKLKKLEVDYSFASQKAYDEHKHKFSNCKIDRYDNVS